MRAGKGAGGKVQAAGKEAVLGRVAAARDEGRHRAGVPREQGADRRQRGAGRVGPARVRLQPRGGVQVSGGSGRGVPEGRGGRQAGSFLWCSAVLLGFE